VTTLVVDPNCDTSSCRIWVGVSGGGVWRTNNALASDPDWDQLQPGDFDQNSVGALTLDPTDPKGDTLYLGTGEGHRCSSGCEAGVGIYKTTNGGESWTKLDDKCVSNPTYPCVRPGNDAFLGRSINSIVIDPRNAKHIFVGSALGVRGLSHVIGNGGTTRLEPGANEPGLYESTDGGKTFTEVWDGTKPDPGPLSFGVTDVGLDPLNPDIVYVAAFDAGVWRRDAGAAKTAFSQVFKPQFNQGLGIDRAMFALTVKNGKTRILSHRGHAERWRNHRSARGERLAYRQREPGCGALLASQGTRRAGSGNAHVPGDLQRLAVPHVEDDRQPVLRRPTISAPASAGTTRRVFTPPDSPTRSRHRLEPVWRSSRATPTAWAAATAAPTAAGSLLDHRRRSGRRSYDRPAQGSNVHGSLVRRYDQSSELVRLRTVLRQRLRELAQRDPSRPARDRSQPGQPDPDLRGLGWRGDPHER
jgi:hypothetical protein